MRAMIYLVAALLVACTTPYYPPSIDNPSGGTSAEDMAIIDYIDKRLTEEYYWLDEVEERSASFDRRLPWKSYLDRSLRSLTTNGDDGYLNNKGERVLYSYIRELESDTRTAMMTLGFGIRLYYTIVTIGEGQYGFVIDDVYEGSPAAEAGVRRGDVIGYIDGEAITSGNYMTLFNDIQSNRRDSLRLTLHRQAAESEQDKSLVTTLHRANYYATPVAHHSVIEIDNRRIGYLVYASFDSDYDEELKAALGELAAAGIDDLILDLRGNSGGSVTSAVTLCSSIVGDSHLGELIFELRRNPKNMLRTEPTLCYIEQSEVSLNLDELTVICSTYSASASEMVITALRGLDIPVRLIGSRTEGKNCGMDVTRRTISGRYLEYAPITFMCYNAKGFGDYGEGIEADVDLTKENSYGVSDEYYPLPRCEWGELRYDIALATAVAAITGRSIEQRATRSDFDEAVEAAIPIAREVRGARLEEWR